MQVIAVSTLGTVYHWLSQRLQGATVLWLLSGVIAADKKRPLTVLHTCTETSLLSEFLYLSGLPGAVMVRLVDNIIDNHLGNLPGHLLLGLKSHSTNFYWYSYSGYWIFNGHLKCFCRTSSELPWTHFFMAWENMEPKREERRNSSQTNLRVEKEGLQLTCVWHVINRKS